MSVLLLALLAAGPVSSEPVAPRLRLPETVRPVCQAVDLTLDPLAKLLTGTTEIDVEVRERVPLLWVNARGLDLAEATLDTGSGPVAAQVVPGGDDFVGFSLARPLSPGPVALRVAFAAPISRRELSGVFTMEEDGDRYLFTQFQPIAARQAFPCFDEPSAKIPWRVALRVPRGLVALSNAPLADTMEEGGLTVARFRETRPLPSSLLAFAVGPFEIVELGRIGRSATPSRLVVPRGRGRDTAWASLTTPRILGLLEDYFDRGYPYAKLDQVAIPGVGYAMEHPGLVTYGQDLVVQRPKEETLANRRDWVVYCSHELAHMWFGNLVTMGWWDDTWLNEAFATWMEQRVAAELEPEWAMDLERVSDRAYALESDSLSTARQIRQPIESREDIDEAFDAITYYKGKAVLEMFESWLGEETFRLGVNAYLEEHAWGTATSRDLVEALSRAAGRDLVPTFSSFLDQVGVPLVSARLACDPRPAVLLEQEPYRALGSPAPLGDPHWQVPVCAVAGDGDRRQRACRLLADDRATLRLDEGGCPDWVLPNADMRGFYRVALDREQAARLLGGNVLSPAERVGVASDLEALVASGRLPAGGALELVPVLARDPHPRVNVAALSLLESLESVVPDADLEELGAFVDDVFGTRARALGWDGGGRDDPDLLLRSPLLRAVGTYGGDEELGYEAGQRARRWLRGEDVVAPDLVATLLAVAARHADRSLLDEMVAAALDEPDRQRRGRILTALGDVGEPALARAALALLLDEKVDPREAFGLVVRMSRNRATRPVLWGFLEENWEAVTDRLPRSAVAYLPSLARLACTPAERSGLEGFLRPRVAEVDGASRALDQALERIDQCIARRATQEASAVRFLDEAESGPTPSP